jgi:PAS domain S-box-containing protein
MVVHELDGERHQDWALPETEERLWATLEYTPVGIAHVDPDGRWQLVNGRLSEILGYTRTELLAGSFRRQIAADLKLSAQPVHREYPVRTVERRYVRKQGDVVCCRVIIATVCDADLRPKYHVVTFEQTTAQVEADGVLGAVAHELRLPLSHMKGFISSLRRSDVQWDAETQAEFLADAEDEADRLEGLIENLLDHSAVEGVARQNWELVLPRALVNACLRQMRAELEDRHVRIDVPADVPPLQVDAAAIQRVLANLLDNATKYSARGSPIEVTARVVGEMLEICVDDRGRGVAPADVDRIFEPFFRSDVQTQQRQAGHGLGLAICRSIVTAHGGRIWVVQRPGGGSRFAFSLPLRIYTNGCWRAHSRGGHVRGRPVSVD